MRTYTRTLPMSQWGYLVTPPNSFSRDSGQTTVVDTGSGMEEIPIQKEFEANVSTYIMPPAFGRQNIAGCFTNVSDTPQFYDGFPQMFRTTERIAAFGEDLSLIDVSPVGFSADGDRALIYVEDKCSGWCGGGYFFLLERNGGAWRVVGTSWTWVP